MIVNLDRQFVYRITHIDNIPHVLERGLANKNHTNANDGYTSIGNIEIIDVRSSTLVKIPNYGVIGDYVPFYFTPRSIMLYNIITGYYAPTVPKRQKSEIVVIRSLISKLVHSRQWFFTDGQANDGETYHYNNVQYLKAIDWNSIQNSNFSKSDGDIDRQRRYQAEFLVHQLVPINLIESFFVYDSQAQSIINEHLKHKKLNIPVHIHKPYFFG